MGSKVSIEGDLIEKGEEETHADDGIHIEDHSKMLDGFEMSYGVNEAIIEGNDFIRNGVVIIYVLKGKNHDEEATKRAKQATKTGWVATKRVHVVTEKMEDYFKAIVIEVDLNQLKNATTKRSTSRKEKKKG
ncbi:unnamed protein product [Dovyalis caffra]|uniref:Uncharacterized protein n=1 Tax=Dovyalis caffra TaxID=77055 RepID=A0AAV1SF85_9ROSI|nr:unnamed protein product [Dovyalis caffra]